MIVSVLGILYERYGGLETLSRILAGITAAAILATTAISRPTAAAFAILAFTGVALMHWPLPFVFLGLAPVSVAFAWFKR